MKTLKIVLMLVVFCLTVSGSSYNVNPEIDEILKVDKDDFKISTGKIKEKIKRPNTGMGV